MEGAWRARDVVTFGLAYNVFGLVSRAVRQSEEQPRAASSVALQPP